MLKITLDTNTFRMDRVSPAILKIRGGADVVVTTTTAREIGSVYDPSLSQVQVKPELFVLDESRLATGVLVSAPDATLFERVIHAISNGSFPKPGRRATLTPGEQDQRRDAMIFCTHVREGRRKQQQPEGEAEFDGHLKYPEERQCEGRRANKLQAKREIRHKSLIHKLQSLFDEI